MKIQGFHWVITKDPGDEAGFEDLLCLETGAHITFHDYFGPGKGVAIMLLLPMVPDNSEIEINHYSEEQIGWYDSKEEAIKQWKYLKNLLIENF